MDTNEIKTVDAAPVKSFFIKMLTRDIDLADAILDLLDNCVDGILRQTQNSSGETPYKGFETEIKFDENSFSISDNCGGIPQEFQRYAFRMGKESEDRETSLPMVGVYGIGMKRAIFKIGEQCSILTQNKGYCYKVEITPEWIKKPLDWKLPISELSPSNKEDGTTIVIRELNEGIATRFGDNEEDFTRELIEKVKTHYAFILDKGFQVKINGDEVVAKPTRLIFTKTENTQGTDRAIRPYIYQTEYDGVKVFLSVGFTTSIPSQDDVNQEQDDKGYLSAKGYLSMNAGWTIICNDRAVLYCDRTELTGWGEAGVPRYHTQFIAISGIVEFHSNDASKLPTTTTKRGINASSVLYLNVKNKMREGMQLFTNSTNKWKGNAIESQKYIDIGRPYNLDEIKKEAEKLKLNSVRSGLRGEQFMPTLPEPEQAESVESTEKQISYRKDSDDIQTVQKYLFGDRKVRPSEVGEECFDLILEEAQQ